MPTALVHNYPFWDQDEHSGEDREVWTGSMRIVRNRRRARKLKKRGVPMMDLRAFTAAGYVGKFEKAWFVDQWPDGRYEHT